MATKRTALSLFSGCGGSDLGLHAAGFDIVMANDLDEYACQTYKLNLPNTDVKCSDIREIRSFPSVDLLVGCYPCQGFSQGGARDSSRGVNYLYREFDRVLRMVRPKAFVVENVSGMTRANFAHLLRNQLVRFRSAGYRVPNPQVLDASDFGVAQSRRRLFIVGIRSDFDIVYEYPNPTNSRKTTQSDVLVGLPEWPTGDFYDKPFHWYYMSRNRRREWNEPAPTIVANPRHIPLHPLSPALKKLRHNVWTFEANGLARRFTFREAAILQGFSRDFRFPEHGSLTQRYNVVGNAVPPPLFAAVTRALPEEIW